ncbi:WXG100 family type VII secretion target [Oribacterium sp. NK2B42]|uniref:WXG100 family type VII secretion target n=1 Tax=Oribacterium sp. NK2B42 TaxID=689781 RepID=UPI0003FB92B9|nr:WXG100 family type VII secretion target [Oribacterium sp. NK2B42]
MILTSLRVSDVQDLRQEATRFDEHANEVKKVTDQMLQLVESTNGLWRGEAQQRYNTQFQGLNDDMKVIYDMCHEYSADLIEIAKNYETAENDNVATSSRLKADVSLIQ